MTNAATWEANGSPAFLGALRKPDDKTGAYGFPTQFTIRGPFITRTLFAQAGVPVPSATKGKVTWQEWIDAANMLIGWHKDKITPAEIWVGGWYDWYAPITTKELYIRGQRSDVIHR